MMQIGDLFQKHHFLHFFDPRRMMQHIKIDGAAHHAVLFIHTIPGYPVIPGFHIPMNQIADKMARGIIDLQPDIAPGVKCK